MLLAQTGLLGISTMMFGGPLTQKSGRIQDTWRIASEKQRLRLAIFGR
jgi:hypothetical protein